MNPDINRMPAPARQALLLMRANAPAIVLALALLVGLLVISQANYLLFHILVEMFSIVIALTIFALTWNARKIVNGYLLFLGISLLFTGILDLLHSVAFKGMGVFPGTEVGQPNAANLATQLWLAARYLQSIALVIAPLFLRRRVPAPAVLGGFGLATLLLVFSIFTWRIFPASFLDAGGLTVFKRVSEYAIILVYIIGLALLLREKKSFDENVLTLLAFSIAANIATELAFTEYISVSDLVNLLGHYFKIVSYYLVYKAIIEIGFLQPQGMLYRELAQRENALAASEARERARAAQMEAIMDVVPAVVWIAHDSQSRSVTGNRASAELLHLPPNANHSRYVPEVANRFKIYDKGGKELAAEQLALHRAAATGTPVRDFQETFVFEDGTERNLYGNVSPLLNERGQPSGAVAAFIDITERVRAEQALYVSERRFRTLFETMAEGFSLVEVLYNEQGEAADYCFLEANPALERMVNVPEGSMIGKTSSEMLGGQRSKWLDALDRVVKTGEPQRHEDYSELAGKYFETLINPLEGNTCAMLSMDVTERRESQEALEESEARLRRLVDSNIIGIMYTTDEGRITLANDAFLDMLGYTREDLEAGRISWIHLTPQEYLTADWEHIAEAKQRGAATPYEKEYIRKDGTRVPILLGFAAFEGDPPLYICFILDLTEQKRAEAAVKEYAGRLERSNLAQEAANAELQRANRELQDFAFVASHDLQEPLRKIQAFGERLNGRAKDMLDSDSRDYLDRMMSAAGRMRAMINDLLDLSRVTTRGQPFKLVDLNAVASEVISDLETRIERSGGTVEVGELPKVEADPIQMHQLLQNLVSNALKFHKADQPPLVKVYSDYTQLDKFVKILVSDNGIGFEEQYLDRMFQPFQRLNGMGAYEGSGIGLAICRKIVERHEGTITARSVPGEGSTFEVTLPMRRSAANTKKGSAE